jgi:hypothetical protein
MSVPSAADCGDNRSSGSDACDCAIGNDDKSFATAEAKAITAVPVTKVRRSVIMRLLQPIATQHRGLLKSSEHRSFAKFSILAKRYS